jgi:hypothetical protein
MYIICATHAYVFPPQGIYVFRLILKINSKHFSVTINN